jgi:hypothetical protein
MITTLSIEKADLERFQSSRLKHQAAINSELSNPEFFALLVDTWEKYHKEV